MSEAGDAVGAIRVPMSGRDPTEAHRAVTPLELLFDLSFVVAVAQAANGLHHALVDGEVAIYVVAIAALHRRGRPWREVASLGATAVLVLAVASTSAAVGIPVVVLVIGALASGVVAWQVLGRAAA